MNEKTLYITDLDGTLLRRNQTISIYTAETVSALVQKGMIFSYATARSIATAAKITAAITPPFPVIVYNGTFIVENGTGRILCEQFVTKDRQADAQGQPNDRHHTDAQKRYFLNALVFTRADVLSDEGQGGLVD